MATPAQAGDPLDFLPDVTQADKPATLERDGKIYTEIAANLNHGSLTGMPAGTQANGNLGLDIYRPVKLSERWRGVFNARLDLDLAPAMGLASKNASLTLREAYVNGSVHDWDVTLGRINVRDGVALGYNPSDVFRSGALLVHRTEDPARLRESRLGVVGARLGKHTDLGEFSALLAPQLGSSPALDAPQQPSWYEPRWNAVNGKGSQYYLKYTPPTRRGWYTNMVLHGAQDGSRTAAWNATNNLGQATVVFLELARSRQTSLFDAGGDAARQWHTQLASGLSYTTATRQTLTLEYDYNGAGLGKSDWNGAWQEASAAQLGTSFAEAGRRQDPLSRHSLMGMLQWQRLLASDDDLACLLRTSLVDYSHFTWCEWTYHKTKSEWALSLTRAGGPDRSEYAPIGQRWALGAKARIYF